MSNTVMLLGAFSLLSFMESLLHTVKGTFLKIAVIAALALPGAYAYSQIGSNIPALAALRAAGGSLGLSTAQAREPTKVPQMTTHRGETDSEAPRLRAGASVANPFATAAPEARTKAVPPRAQGTSPDAQAKPRNVYLEKYGDPRLRGMRGSLGATEDAEDAGAYRRMRDGDPGGAETARRRATREIREHAARQPAQIDDYGDVGENAYERAARERGRGSYGRQRGPQVHDDYAGRSRPLYEGEPLDEYRRAYPPRGYGDRDERRASDDYGSRQWRERQAPQGYGHAAETDPMSIQGVKRWIGTMTGNFP